MKMECVYFLVFCTEAQRVAYVMYTKSKATNYRKRLFRELLFGMLTYLFSLCLCLIFFIDTVLVKLMISFNQLAI